MRRVLHRLVHVERAMRRWQVGGSLALALLVLVMLMGAVVRTEVEAPEEIHAQAFVLVDREGKPRMDLRVARNDSTHLVLLDREGQPQLSLNVLPQGGADLVIRDRLNQPARRTSVWWPRDARGSPSLMGRGRRGCRWACSPMGRRASSFTIKGGS